MSHSKITFSGLTSRVPYMNLGAWARASSWYRSHLLSVDGLYFSALPILGIQCFRVHSRGGFSLVAKQYGDWSCSTVNQRMFIILKYACLSLATQSQQMKRSSWNNGLNRLELVRSRYYSLLQYDAKKISKTKRMFKL